MDYSILNKYSFLKTIECKSNEEIEVTEEAINIYWKNYSFYSKENGWLFHQYSNKRNQMSTSGAWLYRDDRKTINIVGDILTAKSAFLGCEKDEPELVELFNHVYHTKGNCIPWPEGCNLGGRPWKEGGSLDVFSRKLIECKKIFEESQDLIEKDKDIKCVQCRIDDGRYLGKGLSNYACLLYWINKEWKAKSWKDFVNENYLQDMVDSCLNPISFVVGKDVTDYHIDYNDKDCIKRTLIQSIKIIIRRGYRIENQGAVNEELIKNIYEELNI